MLRRSGVKASDLSARVPCALQTAYNWLNGDTLPNDRDTASIALAARIGAAAYLRLVRADRHLREEASKRLSGNVAAGRDQRKQVVHSNKHAVHTRRLSRGRP